MPWTLFDADVVVIDEASMVDSFLMCRLAEALPMRAILILVGDVFQLPPVGPGQALKDIMDSGRVPVFHLNTIFRQAAESLIVQNAHRVNRGEHALSGGGEARLGGSDFHFIEEDDPRKMEETALLLCREKIPVAFGFNPMTDIQVITPMHKGPAGTASLNAKLQDALNPSSDVLEHEGRAFRAGDKVMQIKNNYAKEVYNGDIGVLGGIWREKGLFCVNYETGPVTYAFHEMDELVLAYAISVHKAQGSEYPAVVFLLSSGHYPMLARNLVYTALTRARKLLVLFGKQKRP